jgi:hypothetical protein
MYNSYEDNVASTKTNNIRKEAGKDVVKYLSLFP